MALQMVALVSWLWLLQMGRRPQKEIPQILENVTMNHASHCHIYYARNSQLWVDHYEASVFFWDKASYYWEISQ